MRLSIEQGIRNPDVLAADSLALIVAGMKEKGVWDDDHEALLPIDQFQLESIKEVGSGVSLTGYTDDPFDIVREWEERAAQLGIRAYADGDAGMYFVDDGPEGHTKTTSNMTGDVKCSCGAFYCEDDPEPGAFLDTDLPHAEEWRDEVTNGDTMLGYDEWLRRHDEEED